MAKILRYFVITLLSVIFVKSFIIEIFYVPSDSMENTLLEGDYICALKFPVFIQTPFCFPFTTNRIPFITMRGLEDIRRRDVLIFRSPNENYVQQNNLVKYYVKRCLGLPGDTVTFGHNIVYVNHRLAEEDTLNSIFKDTKLQTVIVPRRGDTLWLRNKKIRVCARIIIREGHTVRLADSEKVYIDGKISAFYIVGQDHYFMVGDNLPVSFDSRGFGSVPYSYFVGKAVAILLSCGNSEASGAKLWERIRLNRTARVIH